jgi:hypothetical protein
MLSIKFSNWELGHSYEDFECPKLKIWLRRGVCIVKMAEREFDEASVRLEFPVSLEAILSVSIHADNLKVVLQFILDVLRRHDADLSNLKQRPQG